jgi:amino acid transporter
VVIAVSSAAPAYSMAATLGLVVAIVGVHSPGTMIVSFLPMLCIAYAFRELNKADPDCGITFTWTTRAFGPWAGWMGGRGIIAADVIVMASLPQIAGHYALQLAGVVAVLAARRWLPAFFTTGTLPPLAPAPPPATAVAEVAAVAAPRPAQVLDPA